MTLDTPRNRKLLFLVLNFPLTLILFAAFNAVAGFLLHPEPSLKVLIAIYIVLTALVNVILLGVCRIRTVAMVLTVLMEVILVYALFLYLFLKSY
jgi:hypothetical protein